MVCKLWVSQSALTKYSAILAAGAIALLSMDLLVAARKFGTILGDFLDSRRLLVDFGTILCTLLSMDLLVAARKLGTILVDFLDSRGLLVDFGTILCTLLSMDLLVVARKLTTFQKCC
jgi:hypothetical protein